MSYTENCKLLANSILQRNNNTTSKYPNEQFYTNYNWETISVTQYLNSFKIKDFLQRGRYTEQVSLFDHEKIINNQNS